MTKITLPEQSDIGTSFEITVKDSTVVIVNKQDEKHKLLYYRYKELLIFISKLASMEKTEIEKEALRIKNMSTIFVNDFRELK